MLESLLITFLEKTFQLKVLQIETFSNTLLWVFDKT